VALHGADADRILAALQGVSDRPGGDRPVFESGDQVGTISAVEIVEGGPERTRRAFDGPRAGADLVE
jgi:hypothetical protein